MADSGARILVVDDELSLRRVLSATLTAMGFTVSTQPSGEQAIECLRTGLFDALLLDVNMPGMGGIAACRLLRQEYPQLGILMLTVRQDRNDKLEAFEAGADDYIVKPFDLPDLVARLRAVVHRAQSAWPAEPAPIRIGELELDWQTRRLTKLGRHVHLTPNEFALLHCLMSRAGELVPHADLFLAVWGPGTVRDPRRLRSLIHELRKKIEHYPEKPPYLVTEPGFGCRFRATQK